MHRRPHGGDPVAKQTLIEHNLRLVVYIARRFENTGVGIEDLISIGTIGLIKAVNTSRRTRRSSWPPTPPAASKMRSSCTSADLRPAGGAEPRRAHQHRLRRQRAAALGHLGTDGDTVMRPMEDDVDHQLLREALARLPDRERTIMVLRYGLEGTPEKTQKEVAELMGISQSYISRLEKRITARLRREITRQIHV